MANTPMMTRLVVKSDSLCPTLLSFSSSSSSTKLLPFLSISPLQFILQFDELFGLPGVNLCPQAARLTLIHLNHLVKLLHLRTLLRQILEGPLKLLLDPILVLLLQDIDLGLAVPLGRAPPPPRS